MTAEIAILNRSAVALAADSAVTVGEKVYNSAIKILPLSHKQPIGIMIYNTSTFMGIPWETIIKTYRKQLADMCFDYVQDYCEDFISYLRSGIVPVALQKNRLSFTALNLLQDILNNYENNETKMANEETISDYITNSLNHLIDNWEISPYCSSDELQLFCVENEDQLNETINIIFNGYQLTEDDRLNLRMIVSVYLYTDNFSYEEYTGVVITGFGNEEIFPALYSYTVGLVFGDRLKIQNNKSVNIDGITTNSSVVPFAQQDVVYRYLLGFAPDLQQFSRNHLVDLLEHYNQLIRDRYNIENDDNFLFELKNRAVDAFYEGISEYQKESYINPMHEIIMNLPHNELGNFAETLVNLSSFKKKVSKEQETVGGPIDVAVITKGDGLIWLKRKHYFEKSINHQYFKR
ncbi:hypothetical protein YDYSY3_46170 [Paenibacillus chitinolyticus]|uniref:hypothetical protein n=1 Tax=Paenibacillus chitinolyticus TaxID=79263 RepID=UPI0026E4FD62|nr:hypothetical protein [Paenibacillus chitinolyticus]GKS13617.1 hypothetical protein YDYSY3_46170 [Paenibacillus chitinolyticus]